MLSGTDALQLAVEHMMMLKVIFLGYIRQLHQTDKAFVRRFLDDHGLTLLDVQEFSKLVETSMRQAVLRIVRDKAVETDAAAGEAKTSAHDSDAGARAPDSRGTPGAQPSAAG